MSNEISIEDVINSWYKPEEKIREDLNDAEILMHCYITPSYEGYALTIYRKEGKYYRADGSHCSCYGLEGQWDPEETSKENILNEVERDGFWYFKNEVQQMIEKYKIVR